MLQLLSWPLPRRTTAKRLVDFLAGSKELCSSCAQIFASNVNSLIWSRDCTAALTVDPLRFPPKPTHFIGRLSEITHSQND